MKLALKIALCTLADFAAPFVALVYRKGIWVTPDDPVSPFGCGTTPGASTEPFMQKLYARFPKFVGDWWWCGMRNRAYGLAYKLKPDHFKNLTTYDNCQTLSFTEHVWYGKRRVIYVDGHKELTYFIGKGKVGFHVILGYRLRPVFDEWYNNRFLQASIPYRPVNMDARPILSIRAGTTDD